MKKIYVRTLLTSLFFLPQYLSAQLSDLHYLPPLQQKGEAVNFNMIYLSTPSTDTMIVDVFKGNSTTASWTLTISKSTTTANSSFDPGSMSNSDYNDVTFIQDSKSATVLNNAGLRLQSRSGEQFYVTFRARWNSSHASSLTSKGRAALGTSFRWVGAPNRGGSLIRLSNSIGIMATEDNTSVDIFGYDPACTFRSSTSETGVTNDNLTFTLNRGETYVLESSVNTLDGINSNGWIGSSIQSTKNIVVTVGQLHYQPKYNEGTQDIAIDQLVPISAIGKEYVFVRGNGSNDTEFPILIGTENDTKVYVNGSSTALTTLNNGDYYKIDPSYYSQTYSGTAIPGANMYVTTSKPVYAMQSIAGSTNPKSADLNFIAPVNCLMGNSVNYIPKMEDMSGLTITGGGINIITASTVNSSDITIRYGANGATTYTGNLSSLKKTVSGTSDWNTYFVSGLTGDVSVSATGPIAVSFFGYSGDAGASGYYSGFETLPTIDVVRTGDGCMNNTTLTATAGYTSYSWFKDGVQIAGVTSNSYTPTSAGSYTVNVYTGTCSFTSAAQTIYDCTPEVVVRTTADKSGILAGGTVNLKAYVKYLGFYNATNVVATVTVPSNITITGTEKTYGTVTNSGTTYTWTIGTMRNGEEHILTITGTGKTYVSNTPGTMTVSTTQTLTGTESNKVEDDFSETITVYSAAPTEPSAQPTGLYFTNTGDAEPYNNVVHFTASASADGYLVVRRKNNAPDLTPADGTVYTAGETSGSNYILYAGTATSVTDLLVNTNTDYYYAIFAYSGAGSVINYLTTNPLSGMINTRSTSGHSLGQSAQPSSVGVPGSGVNVSFSSSVASGGTTITVTKTPAIPNNHTQGLPAGILGVAPLHYTVTSSNPSPGTYTIVLDYSALGYSAATWANLNILKRSNSSSNWTDVTANVVSRSVDGITGKIVLTGLSSFSDFAVGSTTGTLPVTWGTFTATQQQRDVKLNWSTLTESNAQKFNLEHSINETNWKSIGNLPAAGFSQTEKKYSLLHANPGSGPHLYRIQQIDNDGKSSYSPIARIVLKLPEEELRILGNPVSNGRLVLQLGSAQAISLMNANGVIVLQKNIAAGLHTLDVSQLPKGVYFLKAGTSSRQISVL